MEEYLIKLLEQQNRVIIPQFGAIIVNSLIQIVQVKFY